MEEYKKSLFIISAPSGAGKTSLIQAITQSHDDFVLSISHTTRPMRPGESDGDDYFFITKALFEQMIENNDFAEYAKVFGNYYGTSKKAIEKLVEANKSILFDVDWQGAEKLKKVFSNAISIFILPPSLEVLQHRLIERSQDSDAEIASRMKKAKSEISHYKNYDFFVINDEFQDAAEHLLSIMQYPQNSQKYGKKENIDLIERLLCE
ncbi:MAG: guanylate kinase [Pseudomonadota bacterium]